MKHLNALPQRIGNCAVRAMLHEVSASPKPGLVDRLTNGAHRDMNFFSFIDSAVAIGPHLARMAQIALEWGEELPCDALSQLRRPGVEAERDMFAATGGANTHKGAIFSMGLLCAAGARCQLQYGSMEAARLCALSAQLASDAQGDFSRNDLLPTNGQRLFLSHRIQGARGEACSAFASVREYALPVYRQLLAQGEDRNAVYLQTLLHLMANVEDTNVIARCGLPALHYVQQQAAALLEKGGIFAPDGPEELALLDSDFTKKNISPGGCADLLAVTILLEELEELGKTLHREDLQGI